MVNKTHNLKFNFCTKNYDETKKAVGQQTDSNPVYWKLYAYDSAIFNYNYGWVNFCPNWVQKNHIS